MAIRNEVRISSLPIGSAFECPLLSTSINGRLLDIGPGSVTVELLDGKIVHWCLESLVYQISEEELEMAKKKAKKEKKAKVTNGNAEKVSGRKPTLAPFVDNPFPIYATYKDKEYRAQVLGSGMIVFDDKEYATPSAAGRAIMGEKDGKALQCPGWIFWQYIEDGKRVPLDNIRGSKSPLKKAVAA